MGALHHLRLPTHPNLSPTHPNPSPTYPTSIESIRDITGAEKTIKKPARIQVACINSYKMLAI